LESASPGLTKRYEQVFTRLVGVKVLLGLVKKGVDVLWIPAITNHVGKNGSVSLFQNRSQRRNPGVYIPSHSLHSATRRVVGILVTL
jgi:hypothetical protein